MASRNSLRSGAAFAGLLVVVACQPASDERALASITGEVLEAHTTVLAHDSLEGRGTGRPGYERAVRYVETELRRLGLEPAGVDGGYRQPVPLREARVIDASVSIVRAGQTERLTPGDDFIASPSFRDTAGAIEAPVVYVGYGVTAPAFGYDDYAGVDARGKIVAVLRGAPPSLPPNPRAHYGGPEKSRIAAANGAVGMITLWTEDAEKVFPWAAIRGFLTTRPGMTWLDGPGRLPAESPELAGSATLHAARAAGLFRGAKVSWADAMAAARESRSTSVDLPVRVRIERRTALRELEAPNVIGRIRGADRALRDEYVVFTAHLDHDGIGPPMDGDSIYNGAVDNASGVAALLAIAQAFAEGPAPRRSLLFVATAAEEAGLLGAAYFAAHPVVPIDAIVANLNMDANHMLFPTKSIVALGGQHSTLGAVARQATEAAGLALETDLMPEQAFFVRSDQYPFVRKGVPALFFVNGLQSADSAVNGPAVLGKWLTTVYHSPKDDLQQPMHWETGAQYARVVYRIGRMVADDPARPQWSEGDFFGEAFGAERAAAR